MYTCLYRGSYIVHAWWSLLLGSCNIIWNQQPVQATLPCDPTGVYITLLCISSPSSLVVSWFWTQNVSQAGINGTQILNEAPYTVTGFVPSFRTLLFQVNEFTVGYYWCEITDAGVDVRPSTIAPLCGNNSLPPCPDPYEDYPHDSHSQCAIEDSGYTVSHSSLPIDCNVYLPSSTTILQSETTNSPSSVPDFPLVSQTTVCPCSSNQPQSGSNSLPWVIAVAGVGVVLVIVICMLVFSVIIIYKLKRTIALLRTQAQTRGEISGSVRYM